MKYRELKNIWGLEAEHILVQYQTMVKPGKVLDLGIGEGRNSLMFALKGHKIEGVDISETALQRCKELFTDIGCEYSLVHKELSEYEIQEQNCSLIISTWSLNFLKKTEAIQIIKEAQRGLVSGGLLYIGVFSKDDPQYQEYKAKYQEVETDSYYIPERNIIKTYFEKNELLRTIESDCEIICIKEDISLDIGHGEEHYHGALELVIRKI
nr:class I SAM-dependent methyltransferase [Anaeromonas frigoriresistens]